MNDSRASGAVTAAVVMALTAARPPAPLFAVETAIANCLQAS